MDRHTIAGTGEFVASPDDEFMENNCVDDPVRLCDFQLLENRIMKTVDSVYQVFIYNITVLEMDTGGPKKWLVKNFVHFCILMGILKLKKYLKFFSTGTT